MKKLPKIIALCCLSFCCMLGAAACQENVSAPNTEQQYTRRTGDQNGDTDSGETELPAPPDGLPLPPEGFHGGRECPPPERDFPQFHARGAKPHKPHGGRGGETDEIDENDENGSEEEKEDGADSLIQPKSGVKAQQREPARPLPKPIPTPDPSNPTKKLS